MRVAVLCSAGQLTGGLAHAAGVCSRILPPVRAQGALPTGLPLHRHAHPGEQLLGASGRASHALRTRRRGECRQRTFWRCAADCWCMQACANRLNEELDEQGNLLPEVAARDVRPPHAQHVLPHLHLCTKQWPPCRQPHSPAEGLPGRPVLRLLVGAMPGSQYAGPADQSRAQQSSHAGRGGGTCARRDGGAGAGPAGQRRRQGGPHKVQRQEEQGDCQEGAGAKSQYATMLLNDIPRDQIAAFRRGLPALGPGRRGAAHAPCRAGCACVHMAVGQRYRPECCLQPHRRLRQDGLRWGQQSPPLAGRAWQWPSWHAANAVCLRTAGRRSTGLATSLRWQCGTSPASAAAWTGAAASSPRMPTPCTTALCAGKSAC